MGSKKKWSQEEKLSIVLDGIKGKGVREIGIANILNIMTGFIHETDEDLKKIIAFIKNNADYIDAVKMFDFKLPSNTMIFNNPHNFGINIFVHKKTRFGYEHIGFDEKGGLNWKKRLNRRGGF